MKQAVGRVRRYGQTKTVNIYHLLTLYTVDVDILQHRTGKVLVKVGPDHELVDPPQISKDSQLLGSGLGQGVVNGKAEDE